MIESILFGAAGGLVAGVVGYWKNASVSGEAFQWPTMISGVILAGLFGAVGAFIGVPAEVIPTMAFGAVATQVATNISKALGVAK